MPFPREHRYEVEGSIGVGGVGEVFRARDTRLGRMVALKRLLPEPGAPAGEAHTRALREATHLAALQHPHIVSVYDVDEDERGPYLIMELVEGDTLEEAVVGRGPFPLEDFLLLAGQTLDALAAAHRVGLLHRDLKPGNVMLKRGVAGESFEVKLLDFGLSGLAGHPWESDAPGDTVEGSVYFMAPEQFTRERPPDARTDLYAVGCLLYFALTASYPVQGETVGLVVERHLKGDVPRLAPRRPEMPGALCAWVMRLLAVRPGDRPESAARALEELQGLREASFDPARATSVPPAAPAVRLRLPAGSGPASSAAPPPFRRRWSGLALLGAGVALGFAAGAVRGGGSWLRRPAPGAPLPPGRATPTAPVTLAATDIGGLRAHLGAEVLAEGRLRTLDSRGADPVFSLRFEPGADGSALALVFFPEKGSSALSEGDLQVYVGHRVRARGQLTEYRGALQIIVRDPAQIEAAY